MFKRDKNRYKVNIKAAKQSNVIDFKSATQKREKKGKAKETVSVFTRLASADLKTPWVIRLLAVLFILILSMLVL